MEEPTSLHPDPSRFVDVDAVPVDRAPAMRVERDREAFLRDPVGRCVVGDNHVVWCPNARLLGAIHWGALDELGVRRLDEVLGVAGSARLAPSCDVVVDCRDVETVDVDSLAILVAPAAQRAPARPGTGRHILVVPPGPRGMLISGTLLQRSGRWHVFHDEVAALASLDRRDARVAYAEACRAAAPLRDASPLIGRLRRDLADDSGDVSVGLSARRLGTSVRTLQRELQRHRTSFSKELQRTRFTAAVDLLRHTDLKIEAVAARVGVSSASRLSKLIRAHLGVGARELRARERHLERAG
jgi:AraC-like DNA-binding protein